MNLNFKEFAKEMVLIIMPVAILIAIYAVLIAFIGSLTNSILLWIIFVLTIIPFMYLCCKLTDILTDKVSPN